MFKVITESRGKTEAILNEMEKENGEIEIVAQTVITIGKMIKIVTTIEYVGKK